MLEPQESFRKKYVEDMLSKQIHYLQQKLTLEISAMKDAIFINMRSDMFHIMKLKDEFISENVKAEMS